MATALKGVILPHLSRLRNEQRIAINREDIGEENFEASLHTARRSGFKCPVDQTEKMECNQKLNEYKKMPVAAGYEGMDFERMATLRKKMNMVVANLWHIQAEIEMMLDPTLDSRKLRNFVKELEA